MRPFLKFGILNVMLTAIMVIILFRKWEWLFYGFILLYPIMHLFGHNHHSGHKQSETHKH